jgi:hypothetical protein
MASWHDSGTTDAPEVVDPDTGEVAHGIHCGYAVGDSSRVSVRLAYNTENASTRSASPAGRSAADSAATTARSSSGESPAALPRCPFRARRSCSCPPRQPAHTARNGRSQAATCARSSAVMRTSGRSAPS